nr:MAG TPA: hypothetical protein [Bacteriophage sp.]DAW45118.1 MAG TPA: hypothetical protein [Bacteriophage sp.]
MFLLNKNPTQQFQNGLNNLISLNIQLKKLEHFQVIQKFRIFQDWLLKQN